MDGAGECARLKKAITERAEETDEKSDSRLSFKISEKECQLLTRILDNIDPVNW